MTTTATWTTATLPAYLLEPGDHIVVCGVAVPLIQVVNHVYFVSLIGENHDVYMVDKQHPLTVHVPDEPVDGYDLFKPRPGWSPLGCTCLSRRDADLPGNWDIVHTDNDCRSHGSRDDWED